MRVPMFLAAPAGALGSTVDAKSSLTVSRGRREEWEVLIRDHHDGYISWEEYDRNQKVIAGNANMKGTMVAGSVRKGGGLLVGLLRCGHCGRKLKVLHHARRDTRYICNV